MILNAIILFVLLWSHGAAADQFQIIDQEKDAAVRYARISVEGRDYYTDEMGRVSISGLDRGAYRASIAYGGDEIDITIQLTESDYLEQVYISMPPN
jgi:hypothetical protein